jgi:predicted MPP superfamily phosphohydrolase
VGLAVAAAVAAVARSEYEKRCLSVETTRIHSPKIKRPLSIVFLTDLHEAVFGRGNGRLLQVVCDAKPDIVLIGGDMVLTPKKGKTRMAVALDFMEALCGRLGVGSDGYQPCVFYADGNHESRLLWKGGRFVGEYEKYFEKLTRLGVVHLDGASAPYDGWLGVEGVELPPEAFGPLLWKKKTALRWPAGSCRPCADVGPYTADAALAGQKETAQAQSGYGSTKARWEIGTLQTQAEQTRSGRVGDDTYRISLVHSPLYFEESAAAGADLTLSGHFHGGTVRLPMLGGLLTPQLQLFNPFCAGTFVAYDRAGGGNHDGQPNYDGQPNHDAQPNHDGQPNQGAASTVGPGGRFTRIGESMIFASNESDVRIDGNPTMIVSRGLGVHSLPFRIFDKPQVVVVKLQPEEE